MRVASYVILTSLFIALPSPAIATEFEFHFWPGLKANEDKQLISIVQGPCGEVANARVKAMPRYSKTSPLVPEQVFELDGKSRVVRSWNIPVDGVPIALRGNDLIFSFFGESYSVTTARKISKLEPKPEVASPEPANCKIPSAFSGSDYARCWTVTDQLSSRKRLLAFLGVCT